MKPASFFTGLILAGLAVSCGPTSVLESVKTDVKDWNTAVQRPTVAPGGGFYRWATPDVTLTVPTTGDRVFYTVNGETPTFTAAGANDYPDTERIDSGTRYWSSGSLGSTRGTYQIRAVTWRTDGKTSGETNAVFRVVGDGGTVWAKVPTALGTGETLAVDSAADGTHYAAGWFSIGGVEAGFLSRYSSEGTETRTPAILPLYSRIEGLKVDTGGNLVVVGTLTAAGNYDFGNGVTASTTATAAGFVARYSPSLNCLGALVASGDSGFHGTAVYAGATDPIALVVGEFSGTGPLTIGSASITGVHTGSNALLFKVNLNTMTVESDRLVSTGAVAASDWFQAVSVDPVSMTYQIAGTFDPAGSLVTWGGKTGAGVAGYRNGVVIYGPLTLVTAVNWIWTQSLVGQNVRFRAIAVNPGGSILTGGDFEGMQTLDTFTGTSAGKNAFVSALSASGTGLGTSGPSGPTSGDSSVRALSLTTKGFYAVGHLAPGTWSWGSATVEGQGTQTPFLVQVGFGASWVWWARTPVSVSNNLSYSSVGTDPLGENRLAVGGSVVQGTTANFGFGVSVNPAGSGSAPLVTRVFD